MTTDECCGDEKCCMEGGIRMSRPNVYATAYCWLHKLPAYDVCVPMRMVQLNNLYSALRICPTSWVHVGVSFITPIWAIFRPYSSGRTSSGITSSLYWQIWEAFSVWTVPSAGCASCLLLFLLSHRKSIRWRLITAWRRSWSVQMFSRSLTLYRSEKSFLWKRKITCIFFIVYLITSIIDFLEWALLMSSFNSTASQCCPADILSSSDTRQ